MKKTSNLFRNLLLSAAAMVGISSCTDSVIEGITEVQEGSSNARKVSITVEDFVPGDEQTRTSISKVGDDYRFAWSEGDQIGIWAVERTDGTECNGAFNYHTVNGGAGTNKVSFDGGDWGLRSDTKYYAFYPMPEGNPYGINNQRDRRALNYDTQKIDPSNPMAHLAKFDYLASPRQTINEDGSINFDFRHLGAIVIFKLKLPNVVSDITSMSLTSRTPRYKMPYITYVNSYSTHVDGNYNSSSAPDLTISCKDGTRLSTDADGNVTIYTMLPAGMQFGGMVDLSIQTSSGKTYKTSIVGKPFEGGKVYVHDKIIFDVNNITQFLPSSEFKTKLDDYLSFKGTNRSEVREIYFSTSIGYDISSTVTKVSTSTSREPIYLGYDPGPKRLYFETKASEIFANNDCSGMFSGFNNLQWIHFSDFNTSLAEDMGSMFYDCSCLTTIDNFTDWDVSNVLSMESMFYNSFTSEKVLSFTNWDAVSLVNARYMFAYCNANEIDLTGFTTSENLYNMQGMFALCPNLTNLNVGGLNTNGVAGMGSMFQKCTSLRSLDLSSFRTENAVDMSGMFYQCSNLTVNIENFTAESDPKLVNMFPSSGTKFNITMKSDFYNFMQTKGLSNVDYHNVIKK